MPPPASGNCWSEREFCARSERHKTGWEHSGFLEQEKTEQQKITNEGCERCSRSFVKTFLASCWGLDKYQSAAGVCVCRTVSVFHHFYISDSTLRCQTRPKDATSVTCSSSSDDDDVEGWCTGPQCVNRCLSACHSDPKTVRWPGVWYWY